MDMNTIHGSNNNNVNFTLISVFANKKFHRQRQLEFIFLGQRATVYLVEDILLYYYIE